MIKKLLLITVLLLVFSFVTPAQTIHWGTNFRYKDLDEMMDAGWTITNQTAVRLVPSGITLEGEATMVGIFSDIPSGTYDWKVGVRGAWTGVGHSRINIEVVTERHTYHWVADGASGSLIFTRDGRVINLRNYSERTNENVELYMEKYTNMIQLTYNGKQLISYLEPDNKPSGVTGVLIRAPPNGTDLYTWAGAFIPDPSFNFDPILDPVTEPSSEPMVNPEVDINPQDPAEPIPPPPPPQYSPQPNESEAPSTGPIITSTPPQESPPSNIIIMVKPGQMIKDQPTYISDSSGEWTVDNNIKVTQTSVEYNGQWEAETHIYGGVGQSSNIIVSTPEGMQRLAFEQFLKSPSSFVGMKISEVNPYEGYSLGYYVQIDTLISGNYWESPTTAVATVRATVSDSQGKVVYETRITSKLSDGLSLNPIQEQAALKVNTYFEDLFKQFK